MDRDIHPPQDQEKDRMEQVCVTKMLREADTEAQAVAASAAIWEEKSR